MNVKLFDIVNGKVAMNPTALWLPEFKAIWDRDKSKGKEKASREISYIVFMHSFQSPYQVYSSNIRESKVIGDYFKDEPKWKPDDLIKEAVKKYNELQDTLVLKMLRTAKCAIEKIEEYFQDAQPSDIDRIVKNAKELGSLIASIDKLEKQVKTEQLENSSIRGGQGIGHWEL